MRAIPALALVLLTFGGYLSGTLARLGVGVSLVLVGIALCGALLAIKVVSLRADVRPLLPLLLLSLSFGYGIFTADPSTSYSTGKLTLLVTLTPLAYIAGAWLADTEDRRQWLAWGVAAWAVAVALAQRMFPNEALASIGRLAGEDLTYQAVGRAVGAGVVVFALIALSVRPRRLYRLAAVAATVILLVVAVGAGSRGPLLGAALAVALIVVRTRGGALLVAGAVAILWYLLPTLERRFFPERLFGLDDNSAVARSESAQRVIEHIQAHPLGTGIGSLQHVVVSSTIDGLVYPHNVLLEIAGEAGLFAALVFVGVVAWAIWRLWRRGETLGDKLTLALLVYFLVNALVSGDINSNRGLWLFLGVAVAAAFCLPPRDQVTRSSGPSLSPPRTPSQRVATGT
ncbi:MAG: O-antigen ligase family protein [Dietzia sp.]|nr:O-antigen ligase family protein [Dietzia sp.]